MAVPCLDTFTSLKKFLYSLLLCIKLSSDKYILTLITDIHISIALSREDVSRSKRGKADGQQSSMAVSKQVMIILYFYLLPIISGYISSICWSYCSSRYLIIYLYVIFDVITHSGMGKQTL